MRKNVCIQMLVMVFLSSGILSAQTVDLSEVALYYQNHTYLYIEKADNWLDAQALCKRAGGYLVALGNDIENGKIAGKFPMPVWIGLSDHKKEGKFVWMNSNRSPVYTEWDSTEPSSGGGGNSDEDFCEMLEGGTWNDYVGLAGNQLNIPKYDVYGYVCEFERIVEVEQLKNLYRTFFNGVKITDFILEPEEDLPTLVERKVETIEEKTPTETPDIPEETDTAEANTAQNRKYSVNMITVMDLLVQNMPESEGKLISDLLSSTFIAETSLRIIGREQREQILAEMEFSMSGCADEACQLEIGKLLAADGIVVGSIGHVGDRYILNIKLIDVETSEAISTSYKIYKSLNDLVDGCQAVVKSLKYR